MARTFLAVATWPPVKEQRLRELVAEKFTALQIADKMTAEFHVICTRSMVIGKIYRLGLVLYASRGHYYRPKKQRARRRRAPAFTPSPTKIAEFLPGAVAIKADDPADFPYKIDIMGLTNNTCRWPIGEPHPKQLFCGEPSADLASNLPYCPLHSARAVTSPR